MTTTRSSGPCLVGCVMVQTTQEDWQLLLSRSPQNAANASDSSNAIRLFYDRQSVVEFNNSKLHNLNTPIACINALHSSSEATKVSTDKAGGLLPVLFLSQGARVMLNMNLWQEVSLCNGAAGTVFQICTKLAHNPPICLLQC